MGQPKPSSCKKLSKNKKVLSFDDKDKEKHCENPFHSNFFLVCYNYSVFNTQMVNFTHIKDYYN